MSACTDLIRRIRNSTNLIIIIVFFSLLTDSMLLTLVDPILPDIIWRIDGPHNGTFGDTVSDSINDNGKYGYLVAAKAATQFICNPFVGFLVGRFGYRRPMLAGSIVLAASTVAFAFGKTYAILFGTRMLQGAASSVTAVTGMGLLASTFTDDADRGKVMGIAIGGISVGIIAGPIYGSVLYQFFGQAVPFLALSGVIASTIVPLFLAFVTWISQHIGTGGKDSTYKVYEERLKESSMEKGLQLFGFKVDKGGKGHSALAVFEIISDPYILVVATNVFLLNLDVSVVLAFLPLRLIDILSPPAWQLGVVVLPTSIGYLLAGLIVPRTVKFLPRWLCSILGLIISTGALVGLAFSRAFVDMLFVTTFLGLALGMVSTSMQPIFAQIVDARHSGVYSNVYAISDMSVCLAMFVGPLIGGPIVYNFGFETLVIGIGTVNFLFSIFSYLLRNIPRREPNEPAMLEPADERQTLLPTSKLSFKQSASLSYRSHISHDSIPTARYPEFLSSIEDLRTSTKAKRQESI